MTGLAEALRPELPAIADEIIAAIAGEVADYQRPLEGEFGRNVRHGVEVALGRFLDEQDSQSASRHAHHRARREIYIELGRGEFREGRSLDALLSAYRVGARVAWRRCVEAGKAAGVEPDVLYGLGEAMFAYIDGLSAESTEGYAEAQSAAAGELALERRRLIDLLLQQPPADERRVAAVAEGASWPLPDRVAVLVADGDDDPDALATRLGHGVIATEDDGRVLALVPDPDAPRRRAELKRALNGAAAALGPTVAWPGLASSADRARLTHRLMAAGTLPGPFAVADEHLSSLVLHADARLAADLRAAALAPLQGLSPRSRDKLEATLRAWLDHHGRIEETAHALDVHPQTVRYRVNQLRERFGARLEHPEARFALAMALRARPRRP